MRIALFSDIHGNRVALDAVIRDAEAFGVDGYVAVGDYVAIGPSPVAVLDAVAALEPLAVVRGNTDRYVVTGDRPTPTLEQAQADPGLVALYAEINASFAWTQGFVTSAGWFDWLDSLPLESSITLEDGSTLLAVHSTPGSDDGEGVHPGHSDAELEGIFDECLADLACVGHTHEPVLRRLSGTSVINLGAVGNPKAPDLRASYVIVESTSSSTNVHHRRVAYDHAAFTDAVIRSRHPAVDYILAFQRGEIRGSKPHDDHFVPPLTAPAV